MIYLIGQIFFYLLVALGLGVAAGWLWRNQQAAAREDELERALIESRSRLPRMETTVRSREQRLEGILAELEQHKEELATQTQRLAERDRTVADLERTCASLRARLDVPSAADSLPASKSNGNELDLYPGDPAETASAACAAGEPPVEDNRREIEEALGASRDELERVQRSLGAEKRRVEELSQERELQRRALEALEQQLDLARERQSQVANG